MAKLSSQIRRLDPFIGNSNSTISECASKIASCVKQVQTGNMSLDEFKKLSSDLSALLESVTAINEISEVQTVTDVFNTLVTILSSK
jgi:hypothetical protein